MNNYVIMNKQNIQSNAREHDKKETVFLKKLNIIKKKYIKRRDRNFTPLRHVRKLTW